LATLAPLKAVAPGAKIAVIGLASAGVPQDAQAIAKIAPWLAQMGFSAVVGPSCHASTGVLALAGDDALRLSELHGAFADPTIAAILCLRGGSPTRSSPLASRSSRAFRAGTTRA
jgi:muramoyltetrapeptide carboxypeptidase